MDTNVLVSALLSPHRAAAQVLDLALAGELTALFDDRIIAEYRDVLTRPRFGLGAGIPARVIGGMVRTGEHVVARPFPVALPDATDRPFAEVALAGRADALVTGNGRHFAPARDLVRVLSPRELLTALQSFR